MSGMSSSSASQVVVPLGQHSSSTTRLLGFVHFVYADLWDRIGDPRVKDYPLFEGGPWPTLVVILGYLYFVLVLGPRLMKHRKAYDLRTPALVYNILMVLYNGLMFFEGLRITKYGTDCWGCSIVDQRSTDPREQRKLIVGYLFFLSKLIELADTMIFVLRKKWNQVSVLHIVHHSLVPLLIWVGFKISPGGNMALFPLLNSAIHTAMYTYYGLTTLLTDEQRKKWLWWKQHLTTVQMVQFVVVMFHSLHVLVLPGCHFPQVLLYIQLFNGLLFLVLFFSFYRATYKNRAKRLAVTPPIISEPSKCSNGTNGRTLCAATNNNYKFD